MRHRVRMDGKRERVVEKRRGAEKSVSLFSLYLPRAGPEDDAEPVEVVPGGAGVHLRGKERRA